MATIEGAKALGLGDVTGSLEPGKEADLVIIETDSSQHVPHIRPLLHPGLQRLRLQCTGCVCSRRMPGRRKTAGKRRSDGCPDGVKREDGTDEI